MAHIQERLELNVRMLRYALPDPRNPPKRGPETYGSPRMRTRKNSDSQAVHRRRRSEVLHFFPGPGAPPRASHIRSGRILSLPYSTMLTSLWKATSLTRVKISLPQLTNELPTRRFQVASASQRRFLSIHEYQSMNLLNSVCFQRSLWNGHLRFTNP